MRFASLRAGACLGFAALLLLGCGSDASPTVITDPSTTTGTTETDDGTSLSFEGPPSVDLASGETRSVTVVTSPPSVQDVRFSLLDAPGDAHLEQASVLTGKDGRGTVVLHAPTTPGPFTLHAFIVPDGPTADLALSVNKQGVGVVEVVPQYDGPRPVDEWVASVVAGTTCAAIKSALPGEPVGALVAVAPAGKSPLIQSVPVGPKLAVAVRAGHFAWGCADAHDIAAGASTKVKVHVSDVPPRLDKTDLELVFEYSPDAAPYKDMLAGARADVLAAFVPAQKSEPAALLDAMSALSSDPAEIEAARGAFGWDALAEDHFAKRPSLRGKLGEWMDLGLAGAAPELTGRITAIEGVPGKALFRADRIGGLDAASSGAPPVHLLGWKSGPDDKVFLSGNVYWIPSRLMGAACRAGAAQDLGSEQTVPGALAAAAACGELAAALGGAVSCDENCLADLCVTALESMWGAAANASSASSSVATIDIGATGQIGVDDAALPVTLSGSWAGHVSLGGVQAAVMGAVTGALSEADSQDPGPGDPSQ